MKAEDYGRVEPRDAHNRYGVVVNDHHTADFAARIVIHPCPTQAEAIRQVGDLHNRTQLTPFAKRRSIGFCRGEGERLDTRYWILDKKRIRDLLSYPASSIRLPSSRSFR